MTEIMSARAKKEALDAAGSGTRDRLLGACKKAIEEANNLDIKVPIPKGASDYVIDEVVDTLSRLDWNVKRYRHKGTKEAYLKLSPSPSVKYDLDNGEYDEGEDDEIDSDTN